MNNLKSSTTRLLALVLGLALTAPAYAGGLFSDSTIGQLLGAVTGAMVGSNIGQGNGRIAAIAVGTLIGADAGRNIGAQMDARDRATVQEAVNYDPTGQSTSWVNPDTGNQFQVTPVKTYYGRSGDPCREFHMNAMIGGKQQQVYGHACRQPDGAWKISNL